MAQADILIADERLLPQAVDLYNSIFRPKREIDFFKRRFICFDVLARTTAGLMRPAVAPCQRT